MAVRLLWQEEVLYSCQLVQGTPSQIVGRVVVDFPD